MDRINTSLDFGNAHLELLSDSRTDDVVQFLTDYFFPDETLCKSIGFKYEDSMTEPVKEQLAENLSILLIDNMTNEIIGCRGLAIYKKGDTDFSLKTTSKEWRHIWAFIEHKNGEMNLFKRFNVDIGVTFMFLCTRKDYRSKGLASRTFQAAILFCKELGLSPVCIKGVGSTLHSQRIYEKCGFETIHVLRHDEYIIDGEVIFKNTEDVESTKCYLKQL